MVTIGKGNAIIDSQAIELYGLSTDTKPTKLGEVDSKLGGFDIPNGSSFFEMDTGNVSLYDATNKVWLAI